eukprot:TRINITY_DN70497_c0_g1_i1.p1 TRINITY_DN70497_c0_g1~~TRINITY_DN70497_c0_g1_i1.p1  ORF type:complete len:160 (+),score=23.27 TRINITY_DN70497_c0_g1_i1:64-480(+)
MASLGRGYLRSTADTAAELFQLLEVAQGLGEPIEPIEPGGGGGGGGGDGGDGGGRDAPLRYSREDHESLFPLWYLSDRLLTGAQQEAPSPPPSSSSPAPPSLIRQEFEWAAAITSAALEGFWPSGGSGNCAGLPGSSG